MSSHNLTYEQQLALMRDRHISLTANAGSGKTTVLVNKYIDILLNYQPVQNDVRRILAITFTKVAASEMKSRVAKKIDSLLSDEISKTHYNAEKIRKLKHLRDRIQYANIATIHSFCNSLLRDYPIEAGIAPNFYELSEFDAIALLDDAIQDVFLDFKNSPKNADFVDLLVRYGKNNIISIIRELINFRRKLYALIDFYKSSDNDILTFYNYKLFKCYENFFTELDNIIQKFLKIEHDSKITDDICNKHSRMIKLFREFEQSLYNSPHIFNIDKIRDIYEITQERTEAKRRPKFFNYLFKQFETEIYLLSSSFDILFNKDIMELTNDQYHSLMLQQISDARLIIEVAEKVFENYQNLKQEMFAVDFDDMIFFVCKMLENQDFARKIRNQYDYILVDEFQDTNSEQFDIISKLCFDEGPSSQDKKLFIVGDPKQSIYSFQGAEVEVFQRATTQLSEKNKANPDINLEKSLIPTKIDYLDNSHYSHQSLNDENKLGVLSLTTSFRMSPNIAGFVNEVFTKLIGEPEQNLIKLKDFENNIKYEPIVCGRATTKFIKNINNIKEDTSASEPLGSISFVLNVEQIIPKNLSLNLTLTQNEQQLNIEQNIENDNTANSEKSYEVENSTEEKLIVKHIKAVVEGNLDYKVFDSDTNDFRKPEYSDIAILARKKSRFGKLIKELISNNIPYVLASGSGFFASPEIQDIREFLNFFADKNDDFAFACVLKSPFIGFTSADLFEIIAYNKQNNTYHYSLYKQFLEYHNFQQNFGNEENFAKYDKVKNILEDLIFYSTRINVSSLISKIVSLDGYNFYISKTPSGNQIRSNFDKLIDYARKFEARGFRSLYDFVEELHYLSENSKEPEAIAYSNENAVRITTVHGAKGAEFPIVYIYDCNFKTRSSSAFLVDKDFGLLFKHKRIIDGQTTETDFIIRKAVMHFHKMSENNEEIRLFYVACTRAKDHLIISSNVQKKIDGGFHKVDGFTELLFDALALKYREPGFETESIPDYITTELKIHNTISPSFLQIPIELFSNYSFIIDEATSNETIKANKPNYHLSISEIVSIPKNKFFYPTQIEKVLESEENFIIKKEFGFDDQLLEENFSREAALSLGSAFHELIEKIDVWINPDYSINFDALTEIAQSIAMNYYNNLSEVDYLIELATNFYNSPFISNCKQVLLSSKREFHLVMPFDSHFIGGVIDCLIEKNNGEIEVWDWKTNLIREMSDLLVLREKYALQMKIYAYIAFNLFHHAYSIICRLFFVRSSAKTNDDDWIVSFEFSRNELERLHKEILELMNKTDVNLQEHN